jgi:hypothetical protein
MVKTVHGARKVENLCVGTYAASPKIMYLSISQAKGNGREALYATSFFSSRIPVK